MSSFSDLCVSAEEEAEAQMLIERRLRWIEVQRRFQEALITAYQNFGNRLNFGSQTQAARHAGGALDDAMYKYVYGSGAMGAVQAAFRTYIKAILLPETQEKNHDD